MGTILVNDCVYKDSYGNSETVHYNEGFINAEKIRIYPLFHVAKIWEKSKVYNKE